MLLRDQDVYRRPLAPYLKEIGATGILRTNDIYTLEWQDAEPLPEGWYNFQKAEQQNFSDAGDGYGPLGTFGSHQVSLRVPIAGNKVIDTYHRVRVGYWKEEWVKLINTLRANQQPVPTAITNPEGLIWSNWSNVVSVKTQGYPTPYLIIDIPILNPGMSYIISWTPLNIPNPAYRLKETKYDYPGPYLVSWYESTHIFPTPQATFTASPAWDPNNIVPNNRWYNYASYQVESGYLAGSNFVRLTFPSGTWVVLLTLEALPTPTPGRPK
jgi:hypothetical protein